MYTTCIFCHEPLGANETIEHFPIGRRLAFDSAKGRLWVVCRTCAQWNLTPLEERWEAVEECERAYRSVRTRVSTQEIGLARLAEGLDLVRIGAPLRPEFAAWRFGDEFSRRRRRAIQVGVVGPGWLRVRESRSASGWRLLGWRGRWLDTVQCGCLERPGRSSERFIPHGLSMVRKAGLAYNSISAYPTSVRLAMEMALHEDAERRAMEGELAELAAAWREAEQVAGIADNLLLPPHVAVFLDKHRNR